MPRMLCRRVVRSPLRIIHETALMAICTCLVFAGPNGHLIEPGIPAGYLQRLRRDCGEHGRCAVRGCAGRPTEVIVGLVICGEHWQRIQAQSGTLRRGSVKG